MIRHGGTMKRSHTGALILVLLLGSSLRADASDQTQFSGTICGEVCDELGRPVAGATIEAMGGGDGPPSGRSPRGTSDDAGRFYLRVQAAGPYAVFAFKEEEFYPDPIWAIYGAPNVTQVSVSVTDEGPVDAGVIRMHASAARVKGTIVDAATGTPIHDAQIALGRSDNDRPLYQTAATDTFSILIPSSGAWISIRADGYETWYFGGASVAGRVTELRLEPKTTMEIKVALRRVESGCRRFVDAPPN
jgi:hypothetical protein